MLTYVDGVGVRNGSLNYSPSVCLYYIVTVMFSGVDCSSTYVKVMTVVQAVTRNWGTLNLAERNMGDTS